MRRKVFNPSASATVVQASFDFQIEQQSIVQSDTGLMRIDFQGTGHTQCFANFMIDEMTQTLRTNGTCGANAVAAIAIPVGWVHVDLTFDLRGDVTSTLAINGAPGVATYFVTAPPDRKYTVQIGTDSTVGLDGLIVDYDSIIVTSHN